jgi:hypothetical protein
MVQTAFTNYDHAGAFEPFPKPITDQVNKKFTTNPLTTTYDFLNGFLISKDPADTTKTEWIIAKATSVRPFAMTYGYELKQVTAGSYILTDNAFAIFSALNTSPKTPALHQGVACMYIDGIVQPDDFLMPSDGTTSHSAVTGVLGHLQLWDGVSRATICAQYQGLIGQSGGKYLRTATLNTTGQLARVYLNAPGAS